MNPNVFFKTLDLKSNQLSITSTENIDNNTIILITTHKESLSNVSTLTYEVYSKNINTFLRNIKTCAIRGKKYQYCKITDNNYKITKDEFFIKILNPFEINYNKFIRYINLSTDPKRTNRKQLEIKETKEIDKSKYSIYIGVKLPTPTQFTANIDKNGVRYYLGCYHNELLAAYAYNCMAIELYGFNYKKLNIIDKPEGYEWVSVVRRVLPIK